jgi:hypothetical protein
MRLLRAITLVFLSFSLAPAQVHAAGHETCIVYSNDAVRAAKKAQDMGCGFSGPSFSLDPQGHFRWCLAANDDSVSRESGIRSQNLVRCSSCKAYANQAAAMASKNASLGCGLTGPEWNPDANAHYRACLSIPLVLANENAKRAQQMDVCKACRQYSDLAVKAVEQNVSLGCGYTGPAWIKDAQPHFGWCLKHGTGAAKQETSLRSSALRTCNQQKSEGTKTAPSPADDVTKGRTLGKRKLGFRGTWDTEMLPGGSFSVTFSQQGNRVTGQFINGSVEGTLEDSDALNFTVTFQSSLKGSGRLTLMQGGQAFEGRWTLDSAPGTVRAWSGKRR